jgi:PucR family transcriptional regulator, purine catabolism regulatory protein
VAALALSQQAAVRDVEAQFQSEILTRLLRGEFVEVDAAASRLHELGWRLRCPLVVAAIGVWPLDGRRLRDPRAVLWLRSTGLALLRQSLQSPSGTGASGMVGHHLTAVFPAADRPRLEESLQWVIDKFHRRTAGELGHGISAGLSADCAELQDAPRALRQAQVAARAGGRRSGPSRPCSFTGLGALGLVLAAAGDDDAADLVAQVLAPLDRLPAREAEGLLATLRALVADNLSFVDAARVLRCHYNTVRHRVHRLEELIGPFSTDPDLRVNISLALRLREFAAESG